MAERDEALERRVLVLMPTARDAERTLQLLREEAHVSGGVCTTLPDLCLELRRGVGALLLTDDAILNDANRQLEDALRDQPAWSAVPVIVLAREGATRHIQYGTTDAFKNMVVVERPVRTRSLISAVLSALRARRNQYRIRDAILERERQAVALVSQDEKLRLALSELARQAEQLRYADQRKDEFLATLAHELRNPLAPISTGLALLKTEPAPELAQKALGVMQRQVTHMVRLIDDLLDVSRITRGKLALKRERITLAQAIDAAVEGSLPILERSQHSLRMEIADGALWLDADLTRIAQVISNLLNNASKYSPLGSTIELSAAREENDAVIRVRDPGLGIPSDRLEDVFEMFSQINRALDRSQGGLGIGLALVRTLVEMHGGSVSAVSPGPDLGSTFTVRLPLAPLAALGPSKSVALAPLAGGQRVLVVDDNEDAAELLALMLEQAGYTTRTAHDGESAIGAAEELHPNIMILDIGLPGMSGYELAQQIRDDFRFADTALIALTGWGTHEDKRKALAAGFDVHLTKPVAVDALQGALARAVRRRAAARTPDAARH